MSVIAIVLLALAAGLVVAVEWPLVSRRLGIAGRQPVLRRRRPAGQGKRRASHLRVVDDEDSDEFARSVERDLASLPTIDEHDRKR
ncbi:MAG: hypothetical protein ACRDM1_04240 [Gaiellaceae bacterium]